MNMYGNDPTITRERISKLPRDLKLHICIPLVAQYLEDSNSEDRETFTIRVSKAYDIDRDVITEAFEYVESGGRNLLLTKKNDNRKKTDRKRVSCRSRGEGKGREN